jgi:MFS superfamily sulfate permease-like transporter
VIIHVVGLGLFNVKMVQVLTAVKDRPRFTSAFALVIGFTAIWATFLHAIEAGIWAAAYLLLKAVPDFHTAMLYSVSAITTYGHSQIFLTDNYRLLGALEALNGIILLGMTTALMYGLIQRVWPIENRALPRVPRSSRA